MRRACAGLLALLSATLLARPAGAGVDVGYDTTLASQYLWRGLTVVNRPVLQPGLWATGTLGCSSATLYLWSNIELGKYDGSSDLSESNGAHALDWTEFSPSFEVAHGFGDSGAELAAGVAGYLYPNQSGYTSADSAAEVYGRATLPAPLGLVPVFSAWYDVTEIDGSYLEVGLSRSFALRDGVAFVASGAAGWNLGQSERYGPGGTLKEPGNFAEDGLTHWELGAALPVAWRTLVLEPSAHVVFGRDEYTRVWSATEDRDVKYWFGLTLQTSRTLLD